MDSIPTDIKLCFFEEAASCSLQQLLALSSISRTFHSLYKLHEKALLAQALHSLETLLSIDSKKILYVLLAIASTPSYKAPVEERRLFIDSPPPPPPHWAFADFIKSTTVPLLRFLHQLVIRYTEIRSKLAQLFRHHDLVMLDTITKARDSDTGLALALRILRNRLAVLIEGDREDISTRAFTPQELNEKKDLWVRQFKLRSWPELGSYTGQPAAPSNTAYLVLQRSEKCLWTRLSLINNGSMGASDTDREDLYQFNSMMYSFRYLEVTEDN